MMTKTKTFAFLLLASLIGVSAHASLSDDIYYTWQGIKIYAGEGVKWAKYGSNRAIEETVALVDTANKGLTGAPSIDERLLPYVDGKDLDIILKNGVDLVAKNTGLAGQQMALNNIYVNLSAVAKEHPSYAMTLIHHEVQHVQDTAILEKNGYTPTALGHVGSLMLDNASQGILQGILEARAYGEQMVYAYQNMKLFKNDPAWKNTYNQFVKDEDFGKAFDQAIRRGKSIEEARKAASLAVLNSDFFKMGYLDKWATKQTVDLLSLQIDEIFKLLNDGKFTKEDLVSADGFWANLCSYETTKNSDVCLAYFARKKTYCAEVEKKWRNCNNLGSRLAGDKLGGRFFTTEEDDKLYEICCKKGNKK